MYLLKPEDFDGYPIMANVSSDERLKLIADAESIAAALYVPSLHKPDFPHAEAAKGIIRKAILYDVEQRGKTSQAQTAGSYQLTNFAPTRSGTFYSPAQAEALALLHVRRGLPQAYSVPVSRW